MIDRLHILHLMPDTENDQVNQVATAREQNIIHQMLWQGITDYKLHRGFYDPINTKKAIHMGHKSIVLSAKEKGLKRCIIAEDDIVFTSKNSWNYFLSQIPKDYDLFCGLIYDGTVENGRILNGMSGTHSLYCIHEKFYDFFLSQPDDNHIDRNLGMYAFLYNYIVCLPYVVIQRGGWSFNLRMNMWYDVYLVGKELYNG